MADDTTPDSWDAVEDPGPEDILPSLSALNINAKPFVPNVNAAEFVPSFAVKKQDIPGREFCERLVVLV